MLETGIMLGLERGRRQLIKEAGLEVGQPIQKSTSTNKPQDCPSNPQVIYEKNMLPCDACDSLSSKLAKKKNTSLCKLCIKLWKSKQYCGVCKKTWFYSDDRNWVCCDVCEVWVMQGAATSPRTFQGQLALSFRRYDEDFLNFNPGGNKDPIEQKMLEHEAVFRHQVIIL